MGGSRSREQSEKVGEGERRSTKEEGKGMDRRGREGKTVT